MAKTDTSIATYQVVKLASREWNIAKLITLTPPPGCKYLEARDPERTGLTFRVTNSGTRTWRWTATNPPTTITLGLVAVPREERVPGQKTMVEAYERLGAAKAANASGTLAALRKTWEAETEQASRPAAEKGALTVRGAFDVWYREVIGNPRLGRRRPEAVRERFQRDVFCEGSIGDVPIPSVTVEDCRAIFKSMTGIAPRGWRAERVKKGMDGPWKGTARVQAGLLFHEMTVFFDWAVRNGKRDGPSPMADLRAPELGIEQARKRRRCLSPEEIGALWAALGREVSVTRERLPHLIFRLALKLLILVPVRTSVLILATWDEIDFDNALWTSPAEHWKLKRAGLEERREDDGTFRPFTVPLSPLALTILRDMRSICGDSRWVCGSPLRYASSQDHHVSYKGLSKMLKRMIETGDVQIGGVRPTPHDLRRTFSTHMSERVSDRIRELCLGHTVGRGDAEVSQVEGTYNVNDYLAPRRKALDLWASMVEEWTAPKGGKVVPIRRPA